MKQLIKTPPTSPAKLSKQLVFIVGCPRSGTTWLRMLLSQSHNVLETGPTHLYSEYFKSFLSALHTMQGDGAGISRVITDLEAIEWIRAFSSTFFERAAEQHPDAQVIVEKTPAHGAYGADIVRLFPDSWFIHVVRDPRELKSRAGLKPLRQPLPLRQRRIAGQRFCLPRSADQIRHYPPSFDVTRLVGTLFVFLPEIPLEDDTEHALDLSEVPVRRREVDLNSLVCRRRQSQD